MSLTPLFAVLPGAFLAIATYPRFSSFQSAHSSSPARLNTPLQSITELLRSEDSGTN